MTSTIEPKDMINLSLRSKTERLKQYRKALRFYLLNTNCKIVYCDNSNQSPSTEKLSDVDFDNLGNRYEELIFDGNKEKSLGKGYGECEIINYALNYSKFISKMNDKDRIIVLTGRVIIRNIQNLMNVYPKENINYEYVLSDNLYVSVITFGTKTFWKNFIEKKWKQINDFNPKFYYEVQLNSFMGNEYNGECRKFDVIKPIIDGISATVNRPYSSVFSNGNERNNTEIFVCGHKLFECDKSQIYIPININSSLEFSGMINANSLDNVAFKDQTYSELIAMYWIWKNYTPLKYIGLCHYRKYFNFNGGIPNFNDIFEKNDIIVSPIKVGASVYSQYAICHNINDLIVIENIIGDKYGPSEQESFKDVIRQNTLYQCNMFVMKREEFMKYCSVLFEIIFEYEKRMKVSTPSDYEKMVESKPNEYLKKMEPNSTVFYQSRIPGFLAERIFTWYAMTKFKNPKFYDMILKEKKYNCENT
jgi:hypothetical protein